MALLDRIRIPNADPDPDPADQNECISGSATLQLTHHRANGRDTNIYISLHFTTFNLESLSKNQARF
jgi:hypothetical protein